MASNATPARREGLLRATRKVIESNREIFAKAGKRLGEIYSEKYLMRHDYDGKWAEKTSEKLIFPRLNCARLGVVNDDYPLGYSDMRFEEPMPQAERKLAASMVVLALVLAIDPRANEYISETMCPFAALPWDWGEDVPGILGRCMFSWNPDNLDSPPGEVLDLLERAAWSARTGDVVPEELALPIHGIVEVSTQLAIKNEPGTEETYHPASYFPSKMHGRIRMAALPDRKSKRVRKQDIDGVTCYCAQDVERWWFEDMEKSRQSAQG